LHFIKKAPSGSPGQLEHVEERHKKNTKPPKPRHKVKPVFTCWKKRESDFNRRPKAQLYCWSLKKQTGGCRTKGDA